MKHHKSLTVNQWESMSLAEQMANIGSEVFRTLSWKSKGNIEFSQLAFERSLELFDITLASLKLYPRLKEVARARELWVDYIYGQNEYSSTDEQWQDYFMQFTYLARNPYVPQ
jgi:hypothetical protein